jgi:hypothetical protein
MRLVRSALLMILVAPLLACPSARPADDPSGELRAERDAAEDEVRARIVSTVIYTVRIYVETDTQRTFLGSLRPRGTQTFVIPRAVLAGRTQIRFRGEPVGPRGRYVSDWIHVERGDVVEWQLFGSPR